MGYDLHITRKKTWSDEGNDISEGQWDELLAKDKSLSLTNQTQAGKYIFTYKVPLAKWNDHYFMFANGNITFKNPDNKPIKKASEMAAYLQARIEGDDGEIYADFTILSSPLKSEYRKLRQANLPEGFPIIDDINPKEKIATEMEVMDLNDSRYDDIQVFGKEVKRYIDRLETCYGIIWNEYNVQKGKDFNRIYLELAVPSGTVSSDQRKKFNELLEYGEKKGVRLIIAEVE